MRSDYDNLEVVLVDNGSPDGSGDRLKSAFPDVCFIQTGRNLGYTGGNNRGIEAALRIDPRYVLVLNNDTVVDPGCVSCLVDAAESLPCVGAVGAKILEYQRPDRIWFAGGSLSRVRMIGKHQQAGELDGKAGVAQTREVSFLTGCCLLLPRGVLHEVGSFKEELFMYVEDVELCLRLVAAGYRLYYQPRARLWHRSSPPGESPPAPWQIVLRDRNRSRVARMYLSRVERLAFGFFFVSSRLVRMARYAACWDWDRAGAVWRGLASNGERS